MESQESLLKPVLFHSSINNLQNKCAVSKIAGDAKIGRATLQRDPHRLEEWASRNLMECNKEKCQILCLRRNMWNSSTGSSSAGEHLGSWYTAGSGH